MPSKHEIRISYSTITDESASEGEYAENGYMQFDGTRAVESSTDDCLRWGLRDALQFMSEHTSHIETCGVPGVDHSWYSGTGCTEDCEGDEIGVCYDLHIDHVSDGTAMRLARLLANQGVYFANVRSLQRRRAR